MLLKQFKGMFIFFNYFSTVLEKNTETLSKNKLLKVVTTFLEGFIKVRIKDRKWLMLLLVLRDRGKVGVGGRKFHIQEHPTLQAATAAGKGQVPPWMRTIKGSLEDIAKAFKIICLSA